VPLNGGDDMNFCNPKKQFPAEEMKACAESIATNM